jgi:hypothetical protein
LNKNSLYCLKTSFLPHHPNKTTTVAIKYDARMNKAYRSIHYPKHQGIPAFAGMTLVFFEAPLYYIPKRNIDIYRDNTDFFYRFAVKSNINKKK